MGKLAAGSLNRRITIQKRAEGKDEWGQSQNLWSDVRTMVPANIAMQTGLGSVASEFVAGGAEQSQSKASIRIRYKAAAGVTAGMRVTYKDEVYDIHAVLPDEAGREYCDLVVSQGAVRV